MPSVLKPLQQLQGGCIDFSGVVEGQVGEPLSELHCRIEVLDNKLFALVLQQGVLGAAEGYLRGYWQADDLVVLVRILVRNRDRLDQLNSSLIARVSQTLLRIWYAGRRNNIEGSQRNIAEHYDLSNDFFKLFLDPTLMYSSAVFKTESQTLEAASIYKLDLICQKLQLKPFDHVIEIGSGWGGFAIYAAEHYGCQVTTVTISQAQYDEAITRIKQAGLQHRVTVRLQDYRDIKGQFDKLVSIEMIEAVGHQYLATYFQQCRKLLKPQGLALIQAITIDDKRYQKALKTVDYIKRYIFPGSFIPCNRLLVDQAAEQDLRLIGLQDIGQSYALTLNHWRQRFFAALPEVQALGFDARFIRMWEFYLCYCEGGFKEGAISTVQMLLQARPESTVRY
ncbi:MAG: class I SAM-dependent methyltransferase [Sphingobacteriales bacterium]|nr:MAG: class I SAM-dependent methyltransferase [Sphingobacteriales bacterium]